ncbi:MAG: hypothetical protein ACKVU1_16900 [bacterium]
MSALLAFSVLRYHVHGTGKSRRRRVIMRTSPLAPDAIEFKTAVE